MYHRVPDFNLETEDQLPIHSANHSCRISTLDVGDVLELIWQKVPVAQPVHGERSRRRSPTESVAALRADSAYGGGIGDPAELFMEEDVMATWQHFQIGDNDGGGSMYGSMTDPSSAIGAGEKCQIGRETSGAAPPVIAGEEDPGSGERGKWRRVEEASKESTVEGSGETVAVAGRRAAVSSSSGRSGERKRKNRGRGGGYESRFKDAEFASGDKRKDDGRTTASGRRARAVEVHNLSERRRRGRINEKMKALQELIPGCNKADKASMLDEAIEYLKALQLQVRMMSMVGRNIGPVMLPGVPAYFPTMGMGMTPVGVSVGMNPGLPMGPDLAVGVLTRPMMQFGPVLPGAPITGPSPAVLARTLVPTMHSSGMVIADQFRVQAAGQRELPVRFSEMPCPSMVQVASSADSRQYFLGPHQLQNPGQFQATAEPDSIPRVDRSDKPKLG